jgi:L-glyceraldehyde 3-phosphate reductase
MALAWVLRKGAVTSVLICGASRVSQIDDNLGALKNSHFSAQELIDIDAILAGWR